MTLIKPGRSGSAFGPLQMPAEPSTSGVILRRFSDLSGTVIRTRSGQRRRTRVDKSELELSLVALDDWQWNTRADAVLDYVMGALLVAHRRAIIDGVRAGDGASQPPLADSTLYSNVASAADGKSGRLRTGQRNRKSLHRGFKTGFFADTIRLTEITGSTSNARVRMLPHVYRNVFIAQEAKRGIEYFFVDGQIERLIEQRLREWVAKAMDGDQIKPGTALYGRALLAEQAA